MTGEAKKVAFFNSPLMRTKITSANVKPREAILGYFLGPFCALISNAIFGSYLIKYYSDVLGWTDTAKFGSLSVLLPLLSVVFVILGNVVVGRFIDNTRTSQGKARPYLLISAPFVVIAIALLFLVPTGNTVLEIIWICVSYNLYYALAYPIFFASHSSLVGLSTRNSKHRGLLATFSNAAGVAAVGIGASIIVPTFLQGLLFVTRVDGSVDAAASYGNWRIAMIAICVITFVGILIEYFFTRERITEENVKLNIKEEKIPMLKQLKAVVSEKYWWLIIVYFLLFQLGGLCKNSSMTYFCDWVLVGTMSKGTAMGMLGLVGGVPTAVGMILAWPIANKLGKQKAVIIGMFISVFGGLVSFIDTSNFYIVCAGVILKGIGSIPAMYVTLALLSDVLDHLEAKNGFRSDGFTMSVYGAIMVGMTGLSSAIINLFLTATGYNAALAVQSKATQTGLIWCYLGIELICYAIIAVMLIFLNVEKHIKKDHEDILAHQKEAVLASGGVWVEPSERLKQEQADADAKADEVRREELKAHCLKKGLSFEEEEGKHQAKVAAKQAAAEQRAAAKAATIEAKAATKNKGRK